jgi:hypothetical protein
MVTGIVASLAVATWIAGFVLIRMTGWVLITLVTLLAGAGLYGGSSGDTAWPLLALILALPTCAAAIMWRLAGRQQ